MKLVTYSALEADGRATPTRVGVLTADGIHDLTVHLPDADPADVSGLIGLDPETLGSLAVAAEGTRPIDPSTVRLLAPLPRPGKMIAVGLNYHSHCREQGRPPPEYPMLFAILPNALAHPHEPVLRPRATEQLDLECELAVVIGRRVKGIGRAEAESAIFGYTVANDVTARDLQREDRQWLRAKSSDRFTPMGPLVVTVDDLKLPAGMRATVNGETWQEASTADMIFDVPTLVAFVSRTVTLEPGDVVLTGTPAGVGHYQRPPRYLADGDVMRCEIDGIGVLENPVLDETPRADDRAVAAGVRELVESVR